MSCSFGEIWLVTSGACTPSTTSLRTVIAMSRLRRHRIGSSWAYSIFAICCSGTATPLRDVTVRSPTRPRSSRSDGTARAMTPTFSMPSLMVVTGAREVLIDDQLQVGRLFVPVELHVLGLVVLPHHIADLVGDVAHRVRIGSDHAELNREADRRTEVEAIDTHAGFGQVAVIDRL